MPKVMAQRVADIWGIGEADEGYGQRRVTSSTQDRSTLGQQSESFTQLRLYAHAYLHVHFGECTHYFVGY